MDEHSRLLTGYWASESHVDIPLSFTDISLWTAIMATILLVTSELMSPYYGRTGIVLNRRRLRAVALIFALVFLSTVMYKIYEILAAT
jgi:hypothetical protein